MAVSEQQIEGVANRFLLLSAIDEAPQKYRSNTLLINALQTQKSFAAFDCPESGIVKMSLNTLKAAAAISVGFERFDKLRVACKTSLEAIEGRTNRQEGSRRSQQQKIKELEKIVESQGRTILTLIMLVDRMRASFRNISQSTVDRPDLYCDKELREINAILRVIDHGGF